MIGVLFAILVIWIANSSVNSIQDVVFFQATSSELSSSEFISVFSKCDNLTVEKWRNDFRDCFVAKKYADGGRDLNYIIDRILRHAEACVETTDQDCRPDFEDFKKIFSEVLEQMKDYSIMYLEEIYSGRDKIKDLKCVEETLSMGVYENCLTDLPTALNGSEYEIQNAVRNGIKCTNKKNIECSKEARTSLNRIVRTIFEIEPPPEEDEMDEKPEPPPPKMWYDYVAEPFISAWNYVKNFFISTFG